MTEEKIKVVVKHREIQGQAVLILALGFPDGRDLPLFEAGAHVDLYLAEGLVRQYSLCGNPEERDVYRLGILKDPKSRGGSLAAHTALVQGAEIMISLPRNHFPLAPGDHRSILVGGGIGITPMITMAHTLFHRKAVFDLHYCCRSETACAFLDELREGEFASHVFTHFDDGEINQRFNPDLVFADSSDEAHVYVCGPAGFMDWVIAEANKHGFPAERIHKEYFQVEASATGRAFEVVAKRSGKSVHVKEAESIAEALARIGIKIKVSCEQGVCGTCLCGLLEGEPDHRDVFLTEDERADKDQIILCCSRARSDVLVLDL